MIDTLAISNYRSILKLTVSLGRLNVITGPNGSGKSNFYRALRLLAETAHGGVVNALAREGGLHSAFWAGPEEISRRMRSGEVPVQGGRRRTPVRLRLGFAGDDFGYSISLGLPAPSSSAFNLDPEIKRECIWAGANYRLASLLVDRNGAMVKVRSGRSWLVASSHINPFDSMFGQLVDMKFASELLHMRETIRRWRFYDYFRTDREAPARVPQIGTRTPVLHHDGRDLAAALQTIREIGDGAALGAAINDAFPGSDLMIDVQDDKRFSIAFRQEGILRALTSEELSDGTLRYLLWVAALLTPRPPSLMVLNEPETSLHPDLLPALARLIINASRATQVWVVTHAKPLIEALKKHGDCRSIELDKRFGQTLIPGRDPMDEPPWHWPD